MLWLALHFASLPLEIMTRGIRASGPLAIASSSAADAEIVACNPEAERLGIRAGMAATAAWTLASSLRVLPRDAAAERAALEGIAAWALQFTPAVSLAAPDEVLLEVGGSCRLFGGFSRLWADVERKLAALGYTALVAAAPTPLAAQWFARVGFSARIRHDDALLLALERLPVDVLGASPPVQDLLQDIGVRTLGECLRLPRNGLARRGGMELLDRLDRALGRIPDPRPAYVPPARFAAALRLPAPAGEADALLFAARRLIAELCGWLAATGQGAQRLTFTLAHEGQGRNATRFELNLVTATRDPAHLAGVLRERLERLALPCPAIAIAMESEMLLPLASSNLSFLPDERAVTETAARLIERLRARLGEEAVRGFDTLPDHRPERAWCHCEPGKESGATGGWPAGARPLWLLASPRPLVEIGEMPQYEGPLTLLTTPERIESGWWDGHDVAREYFVASNPAQSLLWIYREPRHGSWYLHGFFS
jgi:protein ImuB